jgi:hypothetical protein
MIGEADWGCEAKEAPVGVGMGLQGLPPPLRGIDNPSQPGLRDSWGSYIPHQFKSSFCPHLSAASPPPPPPPLSLSPLSFGHTGNEPRTLAYLASAPPLELRSSPLVSFLFLRQTFAQAGLKLAILLPLPPR